MINIKQQVSASVVMIDVWTIYVDATSHEFGSEARRALVNTNGKELEYAAQIDVYRLQQSSRV